MFAGSYNIKIEYLQSTLSDQNFGRTTQPTTKALSLKARTVNASRKYEEEAERLWAVDTTIFAVHDYAPIREENYIKYKAKNGEELTYKIAEVEHKPNQREYYLTCQRIYGNGLRVHSKDDTNQHAAGISEIPKAFLRRNANSNKERTKEGTESSREASKDKSQS